MATDVDPELYYDAANAYKRYSEAVAPTVWNVSANGTAVGAGTNNSGKAFGAAYKAAAKVTIEVAARLTNAFNNIGNLLRHSGLNHDTGEDANKINQRDVDGQPTTPQGDPHGRHFDSMPNPPNIDGGDKPEPDGWELLTVGGDNMCVAEGIVPLIDSWPNGDPDKLEKVAEAWKMVADAAVGTNKQPAEEVLLLTQTADDITAAAPHLVTARTISGEAAAAAKSIAEMTSSYAKALATAQKDITARCKQLKLELRLVDLASPIFTQSIIDKWKLQLKNAAARDVNTYLATLGTTATNCADTLYYTSNTVSMKSLPAVKDLEEKVPQRISAHHTTTIAENQRKGSLAERNAGIDPSKKERIEVVDPTTGRTRVRIPDELDTEHGTQVMREVKNVNQLYATQQLKDMAQYAAEHGYKFVIVVDERTIQGGVAPTLEAYAYDALAKLGITPAPGFDVDIEYMPLNRRP